MTDETPAVGPTEVLRLRLTPGDARMLYGPVDHGRVLALFSDAAALLLIRRDGDEGRIRSIEEVEFLHLLYPGDFIEIRAKIVNEGKISRKIDLEAYRFVECLLDPEVPTAAEHLSEPVLAAKARATFVVTLDRQRRA